jgi:fructokinase
VTSLALVGVNAQGQPEYSFYREGVADRATSAAQLTRACAAAENLSLVCTGALALSPDDAGTYLPWLASQRQAARSVVIDVNLRQSVMPDLDQYRRHVLAAVQFADVIKVSDEDLAGLALPGSDAGQRALHLLANSRAHLLALTCGAEGASLFTRFGQVFHAREAAPVAVVDTVGAGDCFLAGLVVAMLEQPLAPDWGCAAVPERQATDLLRHAIASASLCIMRRGCVPPSRAEVRARLSAAAFELTLLPAPSKPQA